MAVLDWLQQLLGGGQGMAPSSIDQAPSDISVVLPALQRLLSGEEQPANDPAAQGVAGFGQAMQQAASPFLKAGGAILPGGNTIGQFARDYGAHVVQGMYDIASIPSQYVDRTRQPTAAGFGSTDDALSVALTMLGGGATPGGATLTSGIRTRRGLNRAPDVIADEPLVAVPPRGIGDNAPPAVDPLPPTETPAGLLGPVPGVPSGEATPLRFSQPGLIAANPLPIPAGAETRMARKLGRTDPTIGSPNNPEAFQLPDGTYVGPVNTEQWIARNEKLMSPDEIAKAARWYEESLPTYQKYFGEEKAPAMMGAWLIANQNATPGFAQLSATRALEQYVNKTAGMPESGVPGLAADRLHTYWDAILSGDPSKFADFSTGQKIYDFVDSAVGKNTRTFYGDDPRAGAPAVADVHTMRDTGTVDPTLRDWINANHGAEATYNKVMAAGGTEADAISAAAKAHEMVNRIAPDPVSSPSETKYEWAADRVRGITDDLNAMKYHGRDDWTPAQVQAVGWMGMSKLLGRPGMTSESAIRSMERNLSYELDFGEGAPWHQTFPEWKTLSPQEKATASAPVLNQIMDYAKEITGAQENWRLAGTGAWRSDLNPAFRSQFLSSPEVVADVASIIGHLGQQTAVYGTRLVPSGKNFALSVYGAGLEDPAKLAALWKEVYTKHPDLASGFSPSLDPNGVAGLDIGFPGGGKKLQARIENELIPTIQQAGDKLGIDTRSRLQKAETVEPTNNWTVDRNGEAHLRRLSARYGPGIQQRLVDYSRSELEPALRREIEAAIRARGEAGGAGASPANPAPGPPGSKKGVTGAAIGGSLLGGGMLLGGDAEAGLPPSSYQPPPRIDPLSALLSRLSP